MKKKSIYKILSLILSCVLVITAMGVVGAEELSEITPENEITEPEITVTEQSIPAVLTDWTGIADGAGKDDYVPRTYYSSVTGDKRDALRPRMSAIGEGMDGSCALVLGGDSEAITRYETSFAFPEKGSLKRRKNHTVKMMVKLAEGSVETFKLGIRETTSDSYVLEIAGSELTGEWQELTFDYKTGLQSNNHISRLLFSYTAAEGGATILVDNIFVNMEGEEENVFEGGTFETKFNE